MATILIYEDSVHRKQFDRRILKYDNRQDTFTNWSMYGGNTGNKVFLSAIEQYVTLPYNTVIHMSELESNNMHVEYDYIIEGASNLINPFYSQRIEERISFYSKQSKPIFVLGLGIQARNQEELNLIKYKHGDLIKQYVDVIYRSGGRISTRGYITKEFLETLTGVNVDALGCPSLYQNGRNLKVEKKIVSKGEFKYTLNGHSEDFKRKEYQRIFSEYIDNGWYIDQDEYMPLLLGNRENMEAFLENPIMIARYYSYYLLENFWTKGKMDIFWNIYDWSAFLLKHHIDFSFGSRIHGNIIAILNGIPACVYAKDLRTREIAEYYDIPIFDSIIKKKDLFDIYNEIDYDNFNNNFGLRYDKFSNYLMKHCPDTNIDNSYFKLQIEKNKMAIYSHKYMDVPKAVQHRYEFNCHRYKMLEKVFVSGKKIREHIKYGG